MPNDVFGLNSVYDRQVDSTWPESANYGYFAGGNDLPNVCTIDRIDFSNETVSLPGPSLTKARDGLRAVASSDYGYFAGGYGNSTIDRIDFSSEAVAGPPIHGVNLTQGRDDSGAVSSSDYGYFAGGYSSVCIIDRIDFSNETVSLLGSSLSQGRGRFGSVFNSNYGYFGGGFSPPGNVSTIDRIDFSSETVAGPPIHGANLTQGRYSLSAVSSSDYGYFAGGDVPSPPSAPYACTIDRIDFSNETVSLPGPSLFIINSEMGPVFNSNYGYFGGGFSPHPSVPGSINSIMDRIDFSTETVSRRGVSLTQKRRNLAGVSGGKRINARGVRKGTDKDGKGISSTYGYFGGGDGPPVAPGRYCTIDRIDFSSETVAVPPVGDQLTQARGHSAAVFNSNYGYFAGGLAPAFVCTIDRIDFSNETTSLPGPSLTQTRYSLGAVSNSNYGYFGGGSGPPYLCIIDRIDFSSETVSLPGPSLTQARNGLAAVFNSNYGYFAGGNDIPYYFCTIDRIDFSSETVSLPGPSLTQARYSLGAVSNSNYGYFAGGYTAPYVCTIDRIDFSSETVSLPGPSLTQGRYGSSGVSN